MRHSQPVNILVVGRWVFQLPGKCGEGKKLNIYNTSQDNDVHSTRT